MFISYETMGFDISLGKLMNSEFPGDHLGSHLGLQLTGPYPRGPLQETKVKIWGQIFAHRTPLSSRTKYVAKLLQPAKPYCILLFEMI